MIIYILKPMVAYFTVADMTRQSMGYSVNFNGEWNTNSMLLIFSFSVGDYIHRYYLVETKVNRLSSLSSMFNQLLNCRNHYSGYISAWEFASITFLRSLTTEINSLKYMYAWRFGGRRTKLSICYQRITIFLYASFKLWKFNYLEWRQFFMARALKFENLAISSEDNSSWREL